MVKQKSEGDISSEKLNDHFELSDEYKAMMDDILDRHQKGEIKYTSWEDVKANLKNSECTLDLTDFKNLSGL